MLAQKKPPHRSGAAAKGVFLRSALGVDDRYTVAQQVNSRQDVKVRGGDGAPP